MLKLLLCLLFYSTPVLSIDVGRIMQAFQNSMSTLKDELKGSMVAVFWNKKFSYGGPALTENSQYFIGPVSESFTAFLFLKCLQDRFPKDNLPQLLERTLQDVFPESPLLGQIQVTWINSVTLLDLLTHRSGLSDYLHSYRPKIQREEEMNGALDAVKLLQAVTFDTKKSYAYCRTDYFLLGKLIEEMQQAPYDVVFEKIIKKPAGLHDSYAPVAGNYEAFKGQQNFQRLVEDLNKKVMMDFSNIVGASNIISSTADLLQWVQYLYQLKDNRSTTLRAVMMKNYFTNDKGRSVNLGFLTYNTPIGSCFGAQGEQDSYKTFLFHCPAYNVSVIILSNNKKVFDRIIANFNAILLGNGPQQPGQPLLKKPLVPKGLPKERLLRKGRELLKGTLQ